MKTKLKIVIPLFLVFCLLLPVATNNNTQAALAASDPYVIGANVVIEGYYGNVNAALSGDNASEVMPVIALGRDWFTADEQSPALFKTDGVTREYSSDLWTSVSHSYTSVTGLYYTLQRIAESSFSQDVIKQAVTVYTYSPVESFDYTINETMKALDDTYTDANFTCSKMYIPITLDKALMDEFYLAAQEEANFGVVAADYSAVSQQIINLLDDVFSSRILDIIYSPYNQTLNIAADASWTIAEEVKEVLGGNTTDTSINGTTRNVSLRDSVFGYVGWRLAGETVVGTAMKSLVTDGLLWGFEATPTTYTINLDVKTDFFSSAIGLGLSGLLSILQPAEVAALVTALQILWLEAFLIAGAAGVVMGCITRYVTKDKSNTNSVSIIVGLITLVLTVVIYIFATLRIPVG